MAQFFHGIKLVQTVADALKINDVPSDVIALIGTAPAGPENVLTLVRNRAEAKQFGAQRTGFTIPQALEDIFIAANGEQRVLVINPFKRSTMTTAVAAEAHTLVAGKTQLTFPFVGTVVVKNSAGTVTYVQDTDYTLDDFGNIVSLDYTKIAATAQITATYSKPDFTTVTSSVINGSVDPDTRARTGLELIYESFDKYGFDPSILIAPGFTVAAVQSKLAEINEAIGSIAIIDATIGSTIPMLLTSRTPAGTINLYNYNKSFWAVGPWVLGYDPKTPDTLALRNPAPFAAGLLAANDRANGFADSPSNYVVPGVSGTQVKVTGGPTKATGDMQDLNSIGISTFVSLNGFRIMGNRNMSFNANTNSNNAADSFISVYRTLRLLAKAVQLSCVAYLDRKGTPARIAQVAASGQTYINELIGRGDLLLGSTCFFDEANSNVPNGDYVYVLDVMPPTPMEKITFNVRMNQQIANNLFAA